MPAFTTRRKFMLAATGAGVIAIGLYHRIQRPPSAQYRAFDGPHAVLNSIIDTLVPADEYHGALDIGLEKDLQSEMQQKPQLRQQVERLTATVRDQSLASYHRAFEKLDIDQREALLTAILERGSQRQARRDLTQLRNKVLSKYYASAEGHASLNYRLPANYRAYRR